MCQDLEEDEIGNVRLTTTNPVAKMMTSKSSLLPIPPIDVSVIQIRGPGEFGYVPFFVIIPLSVNSAIPS